MTLQINPPVAEWSVCPYCKNKFPPKPGKIYCSRNHKTHATRARRRAEAAKKAVKKVSCPTPRKKKYATEDAANRFNRYGNRPYICEPGCGWWHTSSKGK